MTTLFTHPVLFDFFWRQFFLDKSVRITTQHDTPLCLAARSGKQDLVNLLLERLFSEPEMYSDLAGEIRLAFQASHPLLGRLYFYL
jgi:ankyrin repeat protein